MQKQKASTEPQTAATDKTTPQGPSIPKTGVATRDRIRQIFGEIFFAEASQKLELPATGSVNQMEETKEVEQRPSSPQRNTNSENSKSSGVADQVTKVSVNLETQIMRYFPESKAYQNKARSLIFNLKDKGNVWLK